MTSILYVLLIATIIILIIGQLKNADIVVGLIKGFMFGVLYHEEEYEDNTKDYTLQCLIGFISVNVMWTQNIKE
jgi:hypothetical protein